MQGSLQVPSSNGWGSGEVVILGKYLDWNNGGNSRDLFPDPLTAGWSPGYLSVLLNPPLLASFLGFIQVSVHLNFVWKCP